MLITPRRSDFVDLALRIHVRLKIRFKIAGLGSLWFLAFGRLVARATTYIGARAFWVVIGELRRVLVVRVAISKVCSGR